MSHTTEWDPNALPNAEGKTFVVTGGHAGIGYFISEQLARTGAEVVMASRSEAKARTAMSAVRARVPGARLSFVPLDLSRLSSVAAAAARLSELPRIDALVLNAAAILTAARTETFDGNETVYGVNAVGNFALAAQSMAALERTAGSRLVTLASIAPQLAGLRTIDTPISTAARADTGPSRPTRARSSPRCSSRSSSTVGCVRRAAGRRVCSRTPVGRMTASALDVPECSNRPCGSG